METVFTCRPCEVAALQTRRTGLEWTCPVHGAERQTATVPFRGYKPGCPVCEKAAAESRFPFVGHDNCNSPGSVGHSSQRGHCTADACY